MVRVKFDVSGVIYTIDRDFLDAGPPSNLKQLCATVDPANTDNVYIINRPPELFSAILSLYLTGELHIPMTSCPGAFLKEMDFWEIDPKYLSNCCFYRVQCFQEEQKTLTKFHRHIVNREEDCLKPHLPPSVANLRAWVWSIVEYQSSTMLNKLYIALTFIMILLSILTISLGTCDMFKRNMTLCERADYMKSADMDHFHVFAGLIRERGCDNTTLSGLINGPYGVERSDNPDYERGYDYWSDSHDYEFIRVNVPDTTNTTDMPTKPSLTGSNWVSIKVPNMTVPIRVLVALDLLTLVFFTIDFLSRVLSCPSLLSYFRSIINIADAAALVGTYLHLIVLAAHEHERYRVTWIDILALMQMLRSIRLFRVVRNLTAARVLAFTLWQNVKELCIVLLFLTVGICTFSSILYIIEHDAYLDNIPMGWYWALITMTTVGYGDIIPRTVTGKVVACVCAMIGLLLFALTVPIFVSRFLTLYRYANLRCFSMVSYKDVGAKGQTVRIDDVEMREQSVASPEKGDPLLESTQ